MLRVVFFGNSESVFSNRHFGALLQAPCEMAAVVDVPPGKRVSTNARTMSGSDSFVEMARQRQIPAFEPPSPNTPEFVNALRELAPDLFVAVGYMKLLKSEILAVPRLFAVNYHASLLPAYRGKHPVFWALRNGEKWAGLTVHVMDPNFDTGDILYQVRVRTRQHDTVATLYERIMEASLPLVRRLITSAERGTLNRTPQTNVDASYYSSTREQDFRLDWSCDAEVLRRWIQTSPGECFAEIEGARVFFANAECVANLDAAPPGLVIKVGRTSVTIAAGRDALRVKRARMGQARERTAARLFRELELTEGSCLAF